MAEYASLYDGIQEISFVEGNQHNVPLAFAADRSCELAVECWQLRRELNDVKTKHSLSEKFVHKLQKDIVRLNSNISSQRVELKSKENDIFQLNNNILSQNKRITDLEVSLHGVTASLKKKKQDAEALSKQLKVLEQELENRTKKRYINA